MDVLHLKAPGGWLNDPNGFIYYQGKYHLFYQYFPYAPVWGTMHWGHAVSDDLIHWEHLGVALFPTKHYDMNGIFSGNAIEVDGKMYLYYSGVRYYDRDPENCHIPRHNLFESCQVLITSDDGIHFDNYHGKKVIIPVIHDDEGGHYAHTRDPKVWKKNDCYYMVLGSTFDSKIGRLLVCKSKDAVNWTVESTLEDKRFGNILECPDLFELGGKTFLMISAMAIMPKSEGYDGQTMIGKVDFDEETCEVSNVSDFAVIDHGRDLYATQTCLDEEGRRVLIAWIRMPAEVRNSPDEKPWNGIMCLPRVMEYQKGELYCRIHPNVYAFLNKKLTDKEKERFQADSATPWLGETVIRNGYHLDIGGYKIWMEEGQLFADRSRAFIENEAALPLKKQFTIPMEGEEHKLSIVVEKNLIEIFVDDGKYVLSNAIYHLGGKIRGELQNIYIP